MGLFGELVLALVWEMAAEMLTRFLDLFRLIGVSDVANLYVYPDVLLVIVAGSPGSYLIHPVSSILHFSFFLFFAHSSRLSLPASLLEPIPNLEYWQYADRADFFAA